MYKVAICDFNNKNKRDGAVQKQSFCMAFKPA